jgi:hypothetical protein
VSCNDRPPVLGPPSSRPMTHESLPHFFEPSRPFCMKYSMFPLGTFFDHLPTMAQVERFVLVDLLGEIQRLVHLHVWMKIHRNNIHICKVHLYILIRRGFTKSCTLTPMTCRSFACSYAPQNLLHYTWPPILKRSRAYT